MAARGEPQDIPLDRLQLNLANPRFEEVEDRDQAMIQLLANEQVVELARDIADLGGINPMERMGVYPLEGTDAGGDPYYTTAEGNRRLCAILLLDDPEVVPAAMPNRARYVRTFNQLAQRIDPIESVPCVVFEDMDQARPWLERLHNGARDGTGRRRWTPEQQARNTGDATNRGATQLRDLAISLGIVAADDLSRTTTTQQRFLSNARFRQALGIVRLEDGSLERISSWNDFELMLRRFMADIAEGRINSRSHNSRAQIEEYAQNLENVDGLERRNVAQGALARRAAEHAEHNAGDEVDDEDDTDPVNDAEDAEPEDEPGGNNRPNRRPRRSLGVDDEIEAALHRLNNQKLTDLYGSISSIRCPKHTLLATVGCWSFLECITNAHGKNEATAFDAYINGRVRTLGVEDTPDRQLRRFSLNWIMDAGNITKHNWHGAGYDTQQLFNSMDALKPIIVALIDDMADRE